MKEIGPNEGGFSDAVVGQLGELVDRIAAEGWAVCDGFLSTEVTGELAAEARLLEEVDAFHQAGVGKGANREVRSEIRSDRVLWLDATRLTPVQRAYWDQMETLRLMLNRYLFMGLFDFEAHLAVYPVGAFYRRHLDQFRGVGLRTVSCILYLNRDWSDGDGGQLRLYLGGDATERHCDVLPVFGRLVVFLSADFYHEVLPAQRERLSLTGWFRRRADIPVGG